MINEIGYQTDIKFFPIKYFYRKYTHFKNSKSSIVKSYLFQFQGGILNQ